MFAGGLYLYNIISNLYFEKIPPIENVMPPIPDTDMEQSLDLQRYAERQANPVIRTQPAFSDDAQSFQELNQDNIDVSDEKAQQLDAILKKTMDEQMSQVTQEKVTTEELEPNQTYLIVDVMPQFPGGRQALLKFLTNAMNYPADAQRRKVQGQVICSFVVDTDGSVIDIRVDKKIDPVLDREAIHILQQMPQWKPGERLGKPVKVRFSIPFNFGI